MANMVLALEETGMALNFGTNGLQWFAHQYQQYRGQQLRFYTWTVSQWFTKANQWF
jgi:hypothetical protein